MDVVFDTTDHDGIAADVVDNVGYIGTNHGLKGFGEPSGIVLGGEDDMYSQVTIGCGHDLLLVPFDEGMIFDMCYVCQGGIVVCVAHEGLWWCISRGTRGSAPLRTLTMICVAHEGLWWYFVAGNEGLRSAAHPRYDLCRPWSGLNDNGLSIEEDGVLPHLPDDSGGPTG